MGIKLAIIGGSGFYQPGMLTETREVEVETPYGAIRPLVGRLGQLEVAFLPRHGAGHALLPHQLNYRANIWGLKELGVTRILATTAVGSLRTDWGPGAIVIIDQFLDFTKQRPFTFFDQGDPLKAHVDVSEPYCPELRSTLKNTADRLKIAIEMGGCYVCAEGPRYETAAEVRMFQKLGGDLVGMTGVPEVVLARELSLCYANISIVTNWAAGISSKTLSHEEVVLVMNENQEKLRKLIADCLIAIPDELNCNCRPR